MLSIDANASIANNGLEFAGLQLTLGHSRRSGVRQPEMEGSISRVAWHWANWPRLANTAVPGSGIASVNGTATLDSQNNYRVRAGLKRFDTAIAAYSGVLSGPIDIAGNFNTGLRGFTAQGKLSIAPGSKGIPVSGKITAAYAGRTDNVYIQNSNLTLPHSHLSVEGSVNKQLNVTLTTSNLDDLLAAIPENSRPPVELHGQAGFTGTVTGQLAAPQIAGHVTAQRFSIAGRQFDSLNSDVSVKKNEVAVQNGSLGRNSMQANFAGTLGLQDWKPLPTAPLSLSASIQNGDVADLLALAGQPSSEYSGQLTGNASIQGTLGNPQGAGTLIVTSR